MFIILIDHIFLFMIIYLGSIGDHKPLNCLVIKSRLFLFITSYKALLSLIYFYLHYGQEKGANIDGLKIKSICI